MKRQIADLERKAHEADLERLAQSPSFASQGTSSQNAEIKELRHQLSAARQSVYDLKKSLRDAESQATATARELQDRLDELEEEKCSLERALDDAQAAADEAATAHEAVVQKYKQKAERYRRERDELATTAREQQHQRRTAAERYNHNNHSGGGGVSSSSMMASDERRELHQMLRESQLQADRLDRQAREQREALDELTAADTVLRKKLDRARSERAAYRAGAERLHKDVKALKQARDRAIAEAEEAREEAAAAAAAAAAATAVEGKTETVLRTGVVFDSGGADTDAIIRASEAAERRHEKELRGMVMQMEWLKASWDREAQLRTDAAWAKQYLLMEIKMRDAWCVFKFASCCFLCSLPRPLLCLLRLEVFSRMAG